MDSTTLLLLIALAYIIYDTTRLKQKKAYHHVIWK